MCPKNYFKKIVQKLKRKKTTKKTMKTFKSLADSMDKTSFSGRIRRT